MSLSYKILSVFGIDIELHLLFIFFIVFALMMSPTFGLLLGILFFYVTLHELSHSIVAIRNKIKVKRIVLLPFGGMAMIDVTDLKPKVEMKMALAGPAFNFLVAGICFLIAYAVNAPLGEWFNQFISGELVLTVPELLLFYSFYANLVLGAFNLLVPAFPLDGGRVLRSLFALKFDYIKATRLARNIGIFLAIMLIAVSYILLGGLDLWIVIIAFFIIFGAMGEYNATVMHFALAKIAIKDVISKEYLKITASTTLKKAVEKMIQEKVLDAIVPGKHIKVLNLQQASIVPREKWAKTKASQVARYVGHVNLKTSVEKIAKRMAQTSITMVPVVENDHMIGVVQKSEISKMMNISGIIGRKK